MNILITGCSSGLGCALFSHFKEYKIYSHGRNTGDLIGDITDINFISIFSKFILDKKINVLINNAGIYANKALEDNSIDDIYKIINTNLTAQILLIQAFCKNSVGERKIVNINSLAGVTPTANESIYCAAKAGFKAFSKSIQLEYIDSGIEIIDVHLGGMKTKITKDRHNYHQLIDPEDVASLIENLLLSKSYYTNEIYIRRRNTSSNS